MATTMNESIERIVNEHLHGTGGFTRHYLTLYSITIGMEAKNVLELGAGFSSRVFITALRQTGGKLTTCDNRSLEKKGLTDVMEQNKERWEYHEMNSRDFLPSLKDQTFELTLHDGAHDFKNIILDLWKIAPRMKKNGIILIHDTYHPHLKKRFLGLAVRIGMLFTRYEIMTLPYGCGLSLIRIKSNAKNGTCVPQWSKDNTDILKPL